MTTSRHYSRSPITEAIIDFQVELPEDVGLSDLERCQDAAYPGKKALNVSVDAIDCGREGLTSVTSRLVGFLFSSADEKQLFQARLAGLTLHRLAPYEGWEPFRDESRRIWDVYCRAARPRKVSRVPVRYLNRLDLPQPIGEVKDFLRTFP